MNLDAYELMLLKLGMMADSVELWVWVTLTLSKGHRGMKKAKPCVSYLTKSSVSLPVSVTWQSLQLVYLCQLPDKVFSQFTCVSYLTKSSVNLPVSVTWQSL